MIINRRRLMGKPKMVMVEYLKSSGDAFIDTGIAVTSNNLSIRFKIRFEVPDVNRRILIGCYELNLLSINLEVYKSGSNNVMRTYSARGSSAINNVDTVALPLNKEIEVDATANFTLNTFNCEYTFEETSHTFNKSLVSGFTNTYKTFILFSDNRTGAGIRPQIANPQLIYSVLIYVDDVLVRDFIPVRKDTIGYMYDKVSGQLFGNSGTGNFTLGQDIVPIEYLESTGTQWIDTEIKVAFPINVKMKFEYISGSGSAVCLLGARYNATWSDKIVWWVNGNQKRFALNYGSLDTGYLGNTTVSGVHTIETDGGYIYEDDVLIYSPSTTPASSDRNYNIYLFALCMSNNTPDLRSLTMKIYSIYIKNGNNVIFDAIPVRKGTTGYLYDKVSGRLYGNAGTGDFILGPDKN